MIKSSRLLAVTFVTLLAGACSSKSGTSGAPPANSAAVAEAKQLFSMRCTPCHGQDGRGDGPASASLNPHPRNFHDFDWQHQATDAHIEKIIQYGGAAVGKSAAMPANPDLTDKPDVVAALKDHIRGMGR